jgi:hypothetical protein
MHAHQSAARLHFWWESLLMLTGHQGLLSLALRLLRIRTQSRPG